MLLSDAFVKAKGFYKFDKLFADDEVLLIFSQELFEEFISVARRPKLEKYFSLIDLNDLLTQISLRGEFVIVSASINICRDKKDNF